MVLHRPVELARLTRHLNAEGYGKEALRSFSVRGVFPGAIGEVDFPDFIAAKVENPKLDVVREFKEQVATFAVQLGIGHGSVLQLSPQFRNCIDWRWQTVLLLMVKTAHDCLPVFYDAPVIRSEP